MLNKKALAATSGVSQYQIERSLRFNSADSAYLTRTPASAGNRKTWTMSLWIKRCALSTTFEPLISNLDSSALNGLYFFFTSADKLKLGDYGSSSYSWEIETTQVFRDTSAWYHIVVAFDTTQATASNRFKLYVNGSQVTAFGTANYPTQNSDGLFNNTPLIAIGRLGQYTSYHASYYMTEVNFIDGQALTPSSFGETDADTGIWKPKAFSGTYGTNGFYLDFSDNSGTTSTTLGKDYSGNSNNWTPNNFSVTAGTGNDSLVDTPTPYGTDTGAGGEVRGNYCTLNALRQATGAGASLANGNLQFTCISGSTGSQTTFASMGMTTGKWYFEMNVTTTAGASPTYYPGIGVNTDLALAVTSQSGDAASGYMFLRNGQKYNSGSLTNYGNAYVNNDVVGVAIDMDAGKIWFSINGTYQNSGSPTGGTNEAFSGITGTAVPCVIGVSSAAGYLNFGQRPFAYTAPSGFKALCTTNLPTPTIGATATTRADDYFNTVLYTGNGSTQTVSGVGFQPDLVWNKQRSSSVGSNWLNDAVRTAGYSLSSDRTDAEADFRSYFTAFNSDGFSLAGGTDGFNANAATYVAWNWKANGAGSSNTAGTITSTVSASTTSGFSIATFTIQTSGSATVGHGLGVAPSLILVKTRNLAFQWDVYHASLGKDAYLVLNDSSAQVTGATTVWNSTAPTSTVFSLGSAWASAAPGNTAVAYCFAPVAGFSAFGSYTGNGSTDGPFVYTGFRPAFVLLKRSSASGNNWILQDAKRDPYNKVTNALFPNVSDAEGTDYDLDFLSNGFKLRDIENALNGSGSTYVYAAFAENPFKYSLGR